MYYSLYLLLYPGFVDEDAEQVSVEVGDLLEAVLVCGFEASLEQERFEFVLRLELEVEACEIFEVLLEAPEQGLVIEGDDEVDFTIGIEELLGDGERVLLLLEQNEGGGEDDCVELLRGVHLVEVHFLDGDARIVLEELLRFLQIAVIDVDSQEGSLGRELGEHLTEGHAGAHSYIEDDAGLQW